MTTERRDRVDDVFQAALDLPPHERDAFVERACAADADLRRAVDRLLGAHDRAQADGFLEGRGFESGVERGGSEDDRAAVGQLIGRYRVVHRIGGGGMGEVFLAHDESLDRRVALKLLTGGLAHDEERVRRFRQEALAASSLNHPNIITIHEVGPWDKGGFMATEFIEGSTLRRLMNGKPLPLPRALDFAVQITRALSAAHGAGIVHRDVKPENVMVRPDGLVKVLDFGIAKYSEGAGDRSAREALVQTRTGAVVGTTAYMSPEQARGLETDARTDIWSLGCVLYEMLAGRPAFGRATPSDTIAAVLDHEPDWSVLPETVPAGIRRLLQRCLTKDPERRLGDVARVRVELEEALAASAGRTRSSVRGGSAALRRPRRAVTAAATVVLAMSGLAAWWWMRAAGPRWDDAALPEIARLVEKEDDYRAFLLARQAQPHLSDKAALQRFWIDHTFPLTVETNPSGASVLMKPYREVDAPWEPLGRTPLKEVSVPVTHLRLRIEKDGFEPIEVASDMSGPLRVRRFTLDEKDKAPKGMVRVPGEVHEYEGLPSVTLGDFWLDRYEVTNRQYKEFVDQSAYRSPVHWKEPFVKGGRVLAWEEAMALFRDSTGRPGPATWELGTYPDGQGDHPVGGVSWFEAAAYARFAGKELPTIHHWERAAGESVFADILLLSNFGGGPAAVGSHQGLSPFGAYDLAGNVKEWCWNAIGEKRYILGGGWNEPSYMFDAPDAQPPWDRAPSYGFRCAKYAAPPPPDQLASIDLVMVPRDYTAEKPVPDEVFRIYRGFYSYDKTELKPSVDSVEESEHWRHEKVSFEAAYGGERVPAHLFLPRNAHPPYQTVVYWPSGEALDLRRSDDLRMKQIEFLVRSGRAVLQPIYKNTYERHVPPTGGGLSKTRDVLIQVAKDLGRSIDYLETRTDIDRERLAFYGVALGAIVAPPLLAIEHRFKAAVLQGGGLESWKPLPEIDPLNFAPRVTMPVLMLNGRYDFMMPPETSQRPLFRLLGTPARDKRHVLFESGQADYPMHDLMKEILDWLDRYLGPVR
jgi:cephalosporin-C deacetylase-like acetyl esterase